MTSASRYCASGLRHSTLAPMRPFLDRMEPSTLWYGPATTAVTYGGRTPVGSNAQVATPRSVPAMSMVAPATGTGVGVGELLMTSQCSGACTVYWKVPLTLGCSNTANTRRVSATSNWLYR